MIKAERPRRSAFACFGAGNAVLFPHLWKTHKKALDFCTLKEAKTPRKSALSELAGMMDPPITKPAMNHRLKKLVQMAKEASK